MGDGLTKAIPHCSSVARDVPPVRILFAADLTALGSFQNGNDFLECLRSLVIVVPLHLAREDLIAVELVLVVYDPTLKLRRALDEASPLGECSVKEHDSRCRGPSIRRVVGLHDRATSVRVDDPQVCSRDQFNQASQIWNCIYRIAAPVDRNDKEPPWATRRAGPIRERIRDDSRLVILSPLVFSLPRLIQKSLKRNA